MHKQTHMSSSGAPHLSTCPPDDARLVDGLVRAVLRQTPLPLLSLDALGGTAERHAQLVASLARCPRLPHAAYVQTLVTTLHDLCADDDVRESYAELLGSVLGGATPTGYATYRLTTGDEVCVWQSRLFSDVSAVVWPAAALLVDVLVGAHRDAALAGLLSRRVVLELGAGTGLAGLVVAAACHDAARVLLTDGEASAVAHMRRNVDANAGALRVPVAATQLEWDAFGLCGSGSGASHDDADEDARLVIDAMSVAAGQRDDDGSSDGVGSGGGGGLLVIGSDLVYEPAAMPALAATLRRLLLQPMESRGGGALEAPPAQCDDPHESCSRDATSAVRRDLSHAHSPAAPDYGGALAVAARSGRRAALLATTRRNADTYAAFTAALCAAGLVHADVTDEAAALVAATGGGVIRGGGGEGASRDFAWDIRVGLVQAG